MESARTPESPHSQPAAAVPGPRLVKLAGLLEDWQADFVTCEMSPLELFRNDKE